MVEIVQAAVSVSNTFHGTKRFVYVTCNSVRQGIVTDVIACNSAVVLAYNNQSVNHQNNHKNSHIGIRLKRNLWLTTS